MATQTRRACVGYADEMNRTPILWRAASLTDRGHADKAYDRRAQTEHVLLLDQITVYIHLKKEETQGTDHAITGTIP